MKLLIAIPTLNRLKKLTDCINSIIKAKKTNNCILSLYFDYEKEMTDIKNKFKDINWIQYYKISNYRAPVFWNSILQSMPSDISALMYINDDVALFEDTLDKIFAVFPQQFPDFDGVMGINQSNLPKDQVLQSAFGVIGKTYLNRFPSKCVWCEQYYRFYLDKELYLYATKINKFYFDESIKVEHHHPSHGYVPDDTHRKVRKYRAIDSHMFNRRQNKKLLWGDTFEKLQETNI